MADRDPDLDAFFDAARATENAPRADFMARLEADARAAQGQARVVAFPPRARSTRLWTGGGLLAAGVAGIAIGLSVPDLLNGAFLSTDSDLLLAELLPSADPSLIWGDVE